ncbi:NB-ARC domain-containing protein [Vibrio splendidus]|uniref:NB-ARC domain-containing protein n=1 Tax=Vibrio splendidus TaxID=29497 RepID=UPI0018E3FBEF|nr:NB-ARC domain-containing protein [Vibrio splendidus]
MTIVKKYFQKKLRLFDCSIVRLLDFIDFYDLSKILNKIKTEQDIFTPEQIKEITTGLEKLTKCRNRVCHSRPLEPNDFISLLDFTYELTKIGDSTNWKNTNEAIGNLDNPSFALSLKIPDFWKKNNKNVSNNLPLPEFDDTGFMGRDKDRKSIYKLLTSNTKVVSIVGEGGIGKTALAQRCLYDMLEVCESDKGSEPIFDIIVWVSLKTNRLTINGIDQIKNAINSSSGLFSDISKTLGCSDSNLSDELGEISEYMEEFKILLCIDNLETISNKDIREFLANIPNSSKVLITTRVGLGEIEYRYKLDKLDDKPSIQLVRNMSRLLNIDGLSKKKNEALKQLCRRLFNNPLLIKWYVLAVASGCNSSAIINKENGSFQEALKFCFENLYDRLGDVEIQAISVIACLRKPVSAVELRFFLAGIDEIAIESALHQLHNSSMLISTGNSDEEGQLYSLTGVAEEYINTIRPVSGDIYKDVKGKRKELQSIIEESSAKKHRYNYDLNSIFWSNRDEKICAIYLKKALTASRKGEIEAANLHMKKAKSIMPNFSECYRINSFLLKDISPYQAETEMETAVELNPNSVITRYAYAQLLIQEEDFERAQNQIDKALEIDSTDIALKTCKAWILTLRSDYEKATLLYEDLIPRQTDRHRKFRISTYDQSASCYRRWAEQFINDIDYSKAKCKLQRAIQLLDDAINIDDYDHGTIKRLCDLLNVSANYSSKTGDHQLIESILNIFEINIIDFTVIAIQAMNNGLDKFITFHPDIFKIRIEKLRSINQPKQTSSTNRILGTIERVNMTDRGVSYGFLNGIDENRYFFHRTELKPNDMLDIEHRNTNVTFLTSENEKGLCAIDIK